MNHVVVVHLVKMRKMIQLNHRECFQMKLWILLLQSRKQISEVAERELRVQPTRNVQFGRAFIHSLSGDFQRIVNVMCVSVGLARCAKEAAELTVDVANVRRVKVPVDVEVSRASVHLPPHRVREFSERVEI